MNLLASRPSRRRRGTALLPALCVVVLLGVLSLGYLRLSIDRHGEAKATADAKRAFYLAEAGFAEAFVGLAAGKSGNVGSDVVPAAFGSGVFWVTAADAGDGRLALKSTGLCGSGRSALSMVVERDVDSVASLGLFGGETLTIEAGSTIDSYDSRDGTYAEQALAGAVEEARIGSNQDVLVRGSAAKPTFVRGDANPGPESAVVRDLGTTITGSTEPLEQEVDLPSIDVPEIESQGDLVYGKSGPKTISIAVEESAYDLVHVTSGATLVLVGPSTVVADVLRVDPGGKLSIDAALGPVRLFVRDHLGLAHGSLLSSTSTIPEDAALLVTAGTSADRDGDGQVDAPVVVEAHGTFHGTIYAPNAQVSLPASLEVFGAVAARSLVLRAGSKMHFDEALKDVAGLTEKLPHLSCWRVVDLPDVEIVRSRLDPLAALEKAGIVPVAASDAHFDVGVAPPSNDPNVTPCTDGLPGVEPPEAEPVDPVAPAVQAQIDHVNDPLVSNDDLKSELESESSLDPKVLVAVIKRKPWMSSSDLKSVLEKHSPLPEKVLKDLLKREQRLTSADLKSVLEKSSPLTAKVLSDLLKAKPPLLSIFDLLSVLAKQ